MMPLTLARTGTREEGRVLSRDPEKAARKQEDRERRQAEKQEVANRAAQEQAEREFQEGPIGRARAAHAAGLSVYQVTLPLGQTKTGVFAPFAHWGGVKLKTGDVSDVLSQIEAEGWRLEHVSCVFREMASTSRDKLLSSGQDATVLGEVLGVYVFRSAPRSPSVPES
jgi:hypothetical protein